MISGMTLISANTLAFGLIGKADHIELFGNIKFGIWKRGRAIGILGKHVRILVTV
jgi:hypothetical protein